MQTPEPTPQPDIFQLQPPPPPKLGSPWLTVWTKPRATIRQVIETNPRHMVHLLMVTGGVVEAFTRAAMRNAGDTMSLGEIILVYSLVGAVGGVLTLYVGAWLLRTVGLWLGGHGAPSHVRAALAWSQVPAVWAIGLMVIELALYGDQMFTRDAPGITAQPTLAAWLMVIESVVAVWGFVILVKCLGEVMGLSDRRSLGAVLLAGLLMVVILWVVEATVQGVVSVVG
jgi:hypothetical protein